MRTNLEIILFPPGAFFPGPTLLPTPLRPPAEQHKGMKNGGCVQFVTLHKCCFLLMLFTCSSMGSFPQETVL